jgi:alanyl-tRNA synthetase
MTEEEVRAVERIANAIVLQNSPVETHLMAVDDAIEAGALALFGEKYGDEVRVVSMGVAEDSGKAENSYSIELCGGTHVKRTGDIGLIEVVSEGAVAAGVRRIEALTATGARVYLTAHDDLLRQSADLLKTKPEDVPIRLSTLLEERRKLERDLTAARRQIAMGGNGAGDGTRDIQDLGPVRLLARTVSGIAPKDLRSLVDDGKRQVGSGIVAIVGVTDEGKAGIVVGVTKDLTAAYNAVDLVRTGAEALGGKGGGGRPDMAQAGGPDGSRADAALAAIAAWLTDRAGH